MKAYMTIAKIEQAVMKEISDMQANEAQGFLEELIEALEMVLDGIEED